MPRKQKLRHKVVGSIQTEPDKWYRLDSPEITECCDCGMVHHTEYVLENGRLFWRAKVDKAATEAARREHGITVTRSDPSKGE